MKLQLRYFLLITILLGAVAIPVGWRQYRKWEATKAAAEAKKLEIANLASKINTLDDRIWRVWWVQQGWPGYQRRLQQMRRRLLKLQDRFEQLTGVRSPQEYYENQY